MNKPSHCLFTGNCIGARNCLDFYFFLLFGSTTLAIASYLLIAHLVLMFQQDEDLYQNFLGRYYFLSGCLVSILLGVTSVVVTRRPTGFQALAYLGLFGIVYLFLDSVGDESIFLEVNPIGMLIFCYVFPYMLYLFSFLRKHTWLIGLGITTKQWESIKSFKIEAAARGINIEPQHPGYRYLDIERDHTWGNFFRNICHFFFTREIPESLVHKKFKEEVELHYSRAKAQKGVNYTALDLNSLEYE